MKSGNEFLLLAAAFTLGCGGKSLEGPGGAAGDASGDSSDVTSMAGPGDAGPIDAGVGRGGGDGSERTDGSDPADGSDTIDAGFPGRVPTTLASMQEPVAMAVDAENVYWTNSDFGDLTVRKVPIAGGPATILASYQHAGPIAVDSTSVYFASFVPGSPGGAKGTSALRKVPLGGGATVTLASEPGCAFAIAVDATNLYWLDDTDCAGVQGTIKKLPLNGGAVTTLASSQAFPSHIAVDATNVYWTSCCPYSPPGAACQDGGVMKVPIAGGTPTTLVAGGEAWGIAVDATSLYWEYLPAKGTAVEIQKMPISGGPVVTLSSCADTCFGLAINASNVTWVDATSSDATLKTVPIAGGVVRSLAPVGDFLGALAVDSTNVYWGYGGICSPVHPDGTSTCDGAVLKMALP
jgi:hypothetical protein